MNKLYFGDNLNILRDHIPSESVDLVYLDPPFNSKRDYNLLFKTPKKMSTCIFTAFLLLCILSNQCKGQNVGDTISMIVGRFEISQRMDTISVVKIKNAGNSEDSRDEFKIFFSSGSKANIYALYGARLINEGDLNGDGLDEFSVFADPLHGCTFDFTTYTHIKKKWRKLFDSFMIPTGCDPISDTELQDRVFLKDGILYYREDDPNDSELVTKRVKIK